MDTVNTLQNLTLPIVYVAPCNDTVYIYAHVHVHVHVIVHAGLMSVLIMHVRVHVGSRLFVIELFCGLFL